MLGSLGNGGLNIVADVIRLESSPFQLPNVLVPAERLILGFASVSLDAAQMISGRARGGVSVYQGQDGYSAEAGWRYRGGDLLIRTPLLTGEAGSAMAITAGGALTLSGTGAAPAARDALGATLSLAGRSVVLDTTVALPSGKLSIKAEGDIVLGADSRIDVSGREVRLLDAPRYSWGGDVELQSMAGNITQARGGLIDVSGAEQPRRPHSGHRAGRGSGPGGPARRVPRHGLRPVRRGRHAGGVRKRRSRAAGADPGRLCRLECAPDRRGCLRRPAFPDQAWRRGGR